MSENSETKASSQSRSSKLLLLVGVVFFLLSISLWIFKKNISVFFQSKMGIGTSQLRLPKSISIPKYNLNVLISTEVEQAANKLGKDDLSSKEINDPTLQEEFLQHAALTVDSRTHTEPIELPWFNTTTEFDGVRAVLWDPVISPGQDGVWHSGIMAPTLEFYKKGPDGQIVSSKIWDLQSFQFFTQEELQPCKDNPEACAYPKGTKLGYNYPADVDKSVSANKRGMPEYVVRYLKALYQSPGYSNFINSGQPLSEQTQVIVPYGLFKDTTDGAN